MNIKKSLMMAGLLSAAMVTSYAAVAEEAAAPAAAEPAPPFTVTFNMGVYSKYMFRGTDYTGGPAVQGGIDLGHSSGLYAGTWWSNLDSQAYGEGAIAAPKSRGNHLETDWYVGFAKTFDNGFGINFLANYYLYPEGHDNPFTHEKYDSFEVSGAFSYKFFTYTYYRVLTDYYGAKTATGGDTDGADYHELKVIYPLPFGGLNLKAKVGYQSTGDVGGAVTNGVQTGAFVDASQGDYAIGVNRDFELPTGAGKTLPGFNAGVEYTNTFSVKNQAFYTASDGRDLNQGQVWAYIKRTW